jgi:Class III cytochrome C family
MRPVSWLVPLVAITAAAAAQAQVFSPGPLNKGHEQLEGLANCTKCHMAGAQLSEQRCLDCHTELKRRVADRQGFHGRLPDAERSCNNCHHEHEGRDFPLIDWGKGGKSEFDHRRTGFPLLGKHRAVKCDDCHQERLVVDASIRQLVKTHAGRKTYLGLPVHCSSCHFDEHRGQLGRACKDCHNEKGWKTAPGFNHSRTDFALTGKHAEVKCVSCHARERDPHSARNAFPAPVSEVFSRFKPVAHDACTTCHKDPHENRFGQQCESCHSVDGWLVLKGFSGKRAFHDDTRYPLRGAHSEVACRSCHGPFPGKPAKFKGIAFGKCTACHVDAHLAQLGNPGDPRGACDRCHTVQAFRPARYEVQDHLSWPLHGAHQTVACVSCHRPDAALESRAVPLKEWIAQRKRKDQISLTEFHLPGDKSRCDTCHRDPHDGQFRQRVQKSGCADCHQVASWKDVRFDHDRETPFPLTGGHAGRSCNSCHVVGSHGVVRYTELPVACASCHADVHAGQFAASRAKPPDCTRCHSIAAWQKVSFEHRPPFTTFELNGKHTSVACGACHTEVAVAAGVRTRRYRGLAKTCEGCHVDVHHGAFRGFTP